MGECSTPHVVEPRRDSALLLGAEAPSWHSSVVASHSTVPRGPWNAHVSFLAQPVMPDTAPRKESHRPGGQGPLKEPEKTGQRPQDGGT